MSSTNQDETSLLARFIAKHGGYRSQYTLQRPDQHGNQRFFAAQADESVDAVVAFDAFQQLQGEPERIDTYVAEVARVLKPGGALVFFERGGRTSLAPCHHKATLPCVCVRHLQWPRCDVEKPVCCEQ